MRIRKLPQFSFSLEVYEAVRESVGRRPPETGGMIGGNLRTGLVTHFHFDETGACGCAAYSPDIGNLNRILEQWNKEKVRLLGFVHSHPASGPERPSGGDHTYAREILDANTELPALLVPIVQVRTSETPFRLRLYIAERAEDGVKVTRVPLRIYETTAKAEEEAGLLRRGLVETVASGRLGTNLTGAGRKATALP